MTTLENSYCYDDILINPCLSNTKSRSEINININIAKHPRELILKTPLISSCMSTVTEHQMAIDMALNGGLGIIHRYMTVEKQVEEVKKVKRFLQYIIEEPYTLNINDTIKTYEILSKKYKVKSFLVIDNEHNGKFIGIFTKRDYENYILNKSIAKNVSQGISQDIAHYMTLTNISFIYYNKNLQDSTSSTGSITKLFENALELMHKNKIKKIPLLSDNVNEYKKCTGLITYKNIKHYLENKLSASLDINGCLNVGAAIGIKSEEEIERLTQLVEAGVNLICIDVANGYNTIVGEFINKIRAEYPNLIIMAGNVCNVEGYKYLHEQDVDCIRIGIGSGSICTTRLETGIGKGQWSAVNECFEYASTLTNPSKIISDGGSLGKTGNKAKALVTGADAVMLGQTMAGTPSSPGTIINRNGKKCKYFRGMASTVAFIENQEAKGQTEINTKINAEGIDGFVDIKGTVTEIIEQINGGIKSCMSYIGCNTIEEVHNARKENKIKFSIITSIGMTETQTRIKTQ